MEVIKVDNLTKDYGNGKGVFDASFAVQKGEVMGFLGPNGAGKTTTIRQLLGFTRPNQGAVTIMGLDCFRDAAAISEDLGYLPGEISFMGNMTGWEFIKFIAQLKKIKDLTKARELIDFFELNASTRIGKMSKGMKQKVAIVCAFMGNPATLILDEPTSGLDPLMQNKFVELVKAEKQQGKTILMSSHIFEEVEKTCDQGVIIKAGRIVAIEDIKALRRAKSRIVEITFKTQAEAAAFSAGEKILSQDGDRVTTEIRGGFDQLIANLSRYSVDDLAVRGRSLEELFMCFYGGDSND